MDFDTIGGEVWAVLSRVSDERRSKIPSDLIKLFEGYKDQSCSVTIIPDISFEKQHISQEAKDILFFLALNYWLTQEEQKEVMNKIVKNTEESVGTQQTKLAGMEIYKQF